MSRRLMLRSSEGVSPVLPAEYQQVEWIGNTAQAAISIPNKNFTQNSVVKCVFRKNLVATSEEALFMAQPTSGGATNIELGFLSGNKIFAYSGNGTSSLITSPLIYDNWVDYTAVFQSSTPIRKATAIVNGTTINGTDGTGVNVTGLAPCALFRNPNVPVLFCKVELASFSLVLEGALSLNLIPCYRKSDGVIGMYDTVSNTFFTNAGTGTFTKGADVN